MATVLIVDDDERLRKMLQRTLIYAGLDVLTAANGQEALNQVHTDRPDLIVLDWMMPEVSGLEVIRRLRTEQDQTLILMLTARDAIDNRVEGLQSGADDYLVKPFAPAELVARVHALLRRSEGARKQESLSFAGLTLDPATREARRGDTLLELTPTEYNLLYYLVKNEGTVLTHRALLEKVWGEDYTDSQEYLKVYTQRLRNKIEEDPGNPQLIISERGVGYKFVRPPLG